jgi:hypothetical protein
MGTLVLISELKTTLNRAAVPLKVPLVTRRWERDERDANGRSLRFRLSN